MKFRVKFELFGKKMQTVIEADSEDDAKYKIMGKIIFHEIVSDDPVSDILNFFHMKK